MYLLRLGSRDRMAQRPTPDAAGDGAGTVSDYTTGRLIETAAAVRKKHHLTLKCLGFLRVFLDLAIGFIRPS